MYSMVRIFVSFAIEDRGLRDLLVGQKVNPRSEINFIDYSVKEPWSNSWKTNCRERINQCSGLIGIVSRNSARADGQLWEIKCAIELRVPLLLIHGYSAPERKISSLPGVLSGLPVYDWSEHNIVSFLRRFEAR